MTTEQDLFEKIKAKQEKGKVVFMTIDGLREADLDEFIKQPTEGILYDLNRDYATVMTFLNQKNPKWINDLAVGVVIAKLKEQIDDTSN